MKKISLLIIGITFVSAAYCQEKENEYRTIFGNRHMSVSGFGAFDVQMSSLGGSYSFGVGGSGGVLLAGQVFLGGFGMGCDIDKTIEMDNITIDHINLGYGGLMFGYIFKHKQAIHPAVFLQTGWGGIDTYEDYNYMSTSYSSDNVFVLNPSIEMELNITKFFRMALGVNYQITTGVSEYNNLDNGDFSGLGGKLSFRFGWFN